MIINHNMGALNANRQMGVNAANANKSMEKLSSGLRINKAGDDAAGLAISEKMRGQIRGLDQSASNAQAGISMIQTAEGALSETTSILQRMRELAVQGSNDTNTTDDRTQIQKEMNQLTSEISRIGNNTEFNTQKLLNGTSGAVSGGKIVTPEVTAKQGVFTAETVGTADVVIDGKTLKYDISGDGSASFKNAADLVKLINNDAELSAKYTAADDGAKLTLTQKVGKESATAADIKGAGTTATTTAGVEAKAAVTTGASSAFTFQIGANEGQQFTASISDMRSAALGLAGKGAGFITGAGNDLSDVSIAGEHALDISTASAATSAITIIDTATASVSGERAKLGAYSNRLEHTIANLGTSSENLTSAESRIRDVDMAKEMSTFSKNNILSQAAQAMLAQANQQPQQVLSLLR